MAKPGNRIAEKEVLKMENKTKIETIKRNARYNMERIAQNDVSCEISRNGLWIGTNVFICVHELKNIVKAIKILEADERVSVSKGVC